jgi:tetratricopeptide (TPR) repeat protein
LLHQALELEDDRTGQAALWHAIGLAHALKFDGEPFWAAMERAIALSDDPLETGRLYADLAAQTAGRAGMWRRLPDRELVLGWIARALELSEPDSAAHATALVASSMWWRLDDPEGRDSLLAAKEAAAIAETLGDPDLIAFALNAAAYAGYATGQNDEALMWSEQAFGLLDEIRDPDLVGDVYITAILPALALGRFAEARRQAVRFEEVNARLTDHHRVHGVAVRVEVEELAGEWPAVLALQERVERAVEENLETPCVRNARTLLVAALARLHTGDEEEAQRLERRAADLWMEGHGLTLGALRIRLALARGQLSEVETLLSETAPPHGPASFRSAIGAASLDALAALRDRTRLEREAPALLRPGTYLEPFALRALGLVREDRALIEQALERFEAMGLAWHAAETWKLL